MDAAQALSDLTEISSQIEAALVLDADGSTMASTLDGPRSEELARTAQELLAAARRVPGGDGKDLAQLEVATGAGSVFVVRDEQRTVIATTGPEPTVGLVFYDLKSCLRSIASEEKPKPKRAPRKAAPVSEAGDDGAA
jgi:predicted regulator of Ras-like GTPase activity (Roadblock/LC7/MglB family)